MRRLAVAALVVASGLGAASFPDPPNSAAAKGTESVVLAGGCFWGVEAVFERLKGVTDTAAGYSGGAKGTAHYEVVSSGRTGHAESVKITYDTSQISFGQILKVYFAVAHDPTTLNRQGYDVGTQYRSAIFYTTPEQKRVAETYIKDLNGAKVFRHPIVTQVLPLEAFYTAEEHHQHFVDRNPTQGYVVSTELPKLRDLQHQFPEMLKGK
jgi:peptide-methionine (S)-S-oxide reductase